MKFSVVRLQAFVRIVQWVPHYYEGIRPNDKMLMCQGRLDRFLKISLDKRSDNVDIFTLDPNQIDNYGQDVRSCTQYSMQKYTNITWNLWSSLNVSIHLLLYADSSVK